MTYDRRYRERLKAPLYKAQEEIDFGSKAFEKLCRDHRAMKWALDEQLKKQKR